MQTIEADGFSDLSQLRETLVRHDGIITTLTKSVSGLEVKIDSFGGILSEIKTSMAAERARPHLSLNNALSYARDIAILVGLVVSGIVYVTQAHSAVTDYRISVLERMVPAQTLLSSWQANAGALK